MMSAMIAILFSMLALVCVLLFQISLKYKTWVTTLSILLTLTLSCATALVLYENIGFPKEIHILEKRWVMHSYIPSDVDQTFYITVQSKGEKPRLMAYKMPNKEKYEKAKKSLKEAQKEGASGQVLMGEYDSNEGEFKFYKFNMIEKYKKEGPQ